MTTARYSVALPLRDEIHTLTDVVSSYVGQDVTPSEILLCVNGSTDGTLELARRLEAEHPGLVRVLESEKAGRKPGAWRAAFAEATNDLVLFGDGDTLPAPQNGRLLSEAVLRDDHVAAVASSIYIVRPERPRSIFDWFSPDPFGVRPGAPTLQGAQYMIHRARWRQVVGELDIPLMPDVVSEDGYIAHAVSVSHNYVVAVEPRSVAYIQPIGSLREYNFAFCRLGHAGRQFDAFPALRTPPAPTGRTQPWRETWVGVGNGLRERDLMLVTKALGSAWYLLSWRILIRWDDRLAQSSLAPPEPSADDLWSLRTAKVRFSPALVEALRSGTRDGPGVAFD